MKYRKKPIVIEATQWFDGREQEGVYFKTWTVNGVKKNTAYVVTIHGQVTEIADGDYIVTEPDGIHHYPVKPEIFEANHEPVSDDKFFVGDAGLELKTQGDTPTTRQRAYPFMELIDRADGVKDHYCIGKPGMKPPSEGTYWDFWNDKLHKWCSAGTVYVGLAKARKKMEQLAKVMRQATSDM